jgi:alginate O-acetyltransferase complex protein AlgI
VPPSAGKSRTPVLTFNSFAFALFFLVVLGCYQLPLSWRAKKGILLGSSYLFYAAWNPPFVGLLVVSTVVDWVAGKRIHTSRGTTRKAWLVLSLCTNLGILSYFKYSPFLLESFSELAAGAGIVFEPATAGIVLPIGISFYTFQTLSYSIDIYRRKLSPSTSFLDYALFVTFFPQLVAGPIVRASEFLPQCLEPKRTDARQLGWGLILLTLGLFQKTILADQVFAPIADLIYGEPTTVSFATAWLGTLAFSGQIFFDFAGYSSCAIGAALCVGFALPDNFRYPYAAIGFSDFWGRWHISLSSWLRDYLYIPLGGNRHGRFNHAASLMLTMLIGGLWHGAGWTFMVWGGLHGLYLVAERIAKKTVGDLALWRSHAMQIALALLTFLLVTIAWVFFRAPDFTSAMLFFRAMFGGAQQTSPVTPEAYFALGAVCMTLVVQWKMRHSSIEDVAERLPRWAVALGIGLLLFIMAITHQEETRGFIYFQF